jgi:hypothetical protein
VWLSEVKIAIDYLSKNDRVKIVPIVLGGCELPDDTTEVLHLKRSGNVQDEAGLRALAFQVIGAKDDFASLDPDRRPAMGLAPTRGGSRFRGTDQWWATRG